MVGVAKKWWKKKGDSVIPYLVCDRQDFFASIFFSPPPFSCHLFFCHTTSFLHPSFFTATTFLSLLFCYQFFQEKCFWKQRQQQNFFGRWQKRGGRKEVTKKRWCRGDGGKGWQRWGWQSWGWRKRGGRKEVTKKRWCRGEWQKRGGKKEVAKKR